jgi:hypothetical protein
MRFFAALSALSLLANLASASPYRADLTSYNLNINQDAQSPVEYQSTRANSTYTPSPANWRALPVYTILLDKFADGDPSNNDFFGSMFENDYRETQLRYGGDVKGLVSKLDYLKGMGVKVIFISGTPFLNMMWEADSELRCFRSLYSQVSLFQVILPSTSPFWTPIMVLLMTGAMPSTKFMPTACTSWPISQLEPCRILSVFKGGSTFYTQVSSYLPSLSVPAL